MVISIHQPSYWPWFGMLDKIARSDIFVVLDNVQLNKDSFQRRNLFLLDGASRYLTIPINYYLGVKINEVGIRDVNFTGNHMDTLRNWYLKAPYRDEVLDWISPIYNRRYDNLGMILKETLFASLDVFGIKTKVVFSSDLSVGGVKGGLVFNICREMKADQYLSGKGALEYFTEDDYQAFSGEGIKLIFQDFIHPHYVQFNSVKFIPGMGCLDFLFNCGFTAGRQLFDKTER